MNPAWRVVEDDARGAEIAALIADHLRQMHAGSPSCHVHALGLAALRAPDITLWTLWEGEALLGCAALRTLGGGAGEVKSMRTDAAHLRRGVASALLRHLIAEAQRRGFAELLLETGTAAVFAPAHALYRAHGFHPCDAFGDYAPNPFSCFFRRPLSAPTA